MAGLFGEHNVVDAVFKDRYDNIIDNIANLFISNVFCIEYVSYVKDFLCY